MKSSTAEDTLLTEIGTQIKQTTVAGLAVLALMGILIVSLIVTLVSRVGTGGGALAGAGGSAAAVARFPPVPADIAAELDEMKPDFAAIIALSTTGTAAGAAYNKTAAFVDRWGWRLSGTLNLEAAIDALPAILAADGLELVHHEDAVVPHWEREVRRPQPPSATSSPPSGRAFVLRRVQSLLLLMRGRPSQGLGWSEACALVSPIIGMEGQPALEAARQQSIAIKVHSPALPSPRISAPLSDAFPVVVLCRPPGLRWDRRHTGSGHRGGGACGR